MEKVKILTDKENIRLNDDIIRSFKKKSSAKVKVNKTNSTSIELELEETNPSFYDSVAKVISNYIVENIEKEIIKEIVYDECDGLPESYIEEVLGEIQWEILYKEDEERKERNTKLNEQIASIIKKAGVFSLQGFMRFRFKNRFLELSESIYGILDALFTKKGTEDFTTIVKKLIRVQLPKTESLHIIALKDSKYKVLTHDNEEINLQDLEAALDDANSDIGYEISIVELIVSTLMSTLPKNVYIHCSDEEDKVFSIVKKIYDGRCHRCEYCDTCDDTLNKDNIDELNSQE